MAIWHDNLLLGVVIISPISKSKGSYPHIHRINKERKSSKKKEKPLLCCYKLGKDLLLLLTLSLGCLQTAEAAILDASSLFSNVGFEEGNLNGWKVTRPNSNYVATLTPPVNPAIDPADPANDPTLLTAPDGSFFTGLKRPGDQGPNLSYKLVHDAIPVSVASDTIFRLDIFANRGRLEPFDTPGSTGSVSVKVFGWTTNASTPTVNPLNDNWSRTINWNPSAQSFDFSGVPDGTWGQRSFVFDPSANGVNPADLKYLSLSVAAQNHNHDQYIAADIPAAPIPEPSSLALLGLGLSRFLFRRKRL